MGWLSNLIEGVHNVTKYVDPIGHALVGATDKVSNQSVSSISGLLGGLGNALGISTSLPDNVKKHADQNKQDFGLSASRAATVASLVYGGMTALGEGGAGAAGGSSVGEVGAEGLGGVGGTAGSAGLGGTSGVGVGAAEATGVGTTGAAGVDGATTAAAPKSEPSLLSKIGNSSTTKQVGTALISQGINAALNKKPEQQAPQTRPVVEMPDPLAQAEARRRKLAEQLARRGRVSTIMTNDGG